MSKLKYGIPFIILGLMIFGYYHPSIMPIVFNYTRVNWWIIFLINFVSIGVVSLIPVLGIFLVSSMAYNLGSQLPLIISKYVNVPIHKILMALSIHGIFEIISMAIALNIGIEMITKPKLKRILYQILIISILLFIGAILEHYISYSFFEYWRTP